VGVPGQQLVFCNDEITQDKQHEHVRRILRQSPVAGLRMTKEVLDHMKRMLDLRPNARFGMFEVVPGHDLLHFRRKLFTVCDALLRSKFGARKIGFFRATAVFLKFFTG
jgi:hypothetical protein